MMRRWSSWYLDLSSSSATRSSRSAFLRLYSFFCLIKASLVNS